MKIFRVDNYAEFLRNAMHALDKQADVLAFLGWHWDNEKGWVQ